MLKNLSFQQTGDIMDYLLDVNAAREEHVHELAVGGTRAQLLNFRIPRITNLVNCGKNC